MSTYLILLKMNSNHAVENTYLILKIFWTSLNSVLDFYPTHLYSVFQASFRVEKIAS